MSTLTMTAPPAVPLCHELAHRATGGLEVTLYWCAHDDSTSVEVWQSESNETLAFPVARERALDAFYHPFAHLPYAS